MSRQFASLLGPRRTGIVESIEGSGLLLGYHELHPENPGCGTNTRELLRFMKVAWQSSRCSCFWKYCRYDIIYIYDYIYDTHIYVYIYMMYEQWLYLSECSVYRQFSLYTLMCFSGSSWTLDKLVTCQICNPELHHSGHVFSCPGSLPEPRATAMFPSWWN